MSILRRATTFAMLCLLAACRLGQPSKMAVSFSAYTNRPVVLTEMLVNGTAMTLVPNVVQGRADDYGRELIMGNRMLGYPKGDSGVMQLKLTWIELPHGAAYQAEIQLPLSELEYSSWSGIDFSPIFAPDGLVIIASDPPAKKGQKRITRDVARICGTRMPDLDFDYTKDPRELPGLFEALQTTKAPASLSECKV